VNPVKKARRWCAECDRYVLAELQEGGTLGHAALVVLTCGLWLVVFLPWVFLSAASAAWRYRGPRCGGRTSPTKRGRRGRDED
jgi:hypothetical protein